jgi:hypothetical protein
VEVTEVEPGFGREAVEEAGPVLHPPEPGLHQRGQLADVLLGEVGQRPFQVRPDRLSRFVIVQGSLDRRLRARRLLAGRACSGWWSGPSSCEHATPREAGRHTRRGHGHPPQMVALTSVPDGELWRSFPEANRNDILGLLGMLLEWGRSRPGWRRRGPGVSTVLPVVIATGSTVLPPGAFLYT